MPDETTILSLPLILPSQAQKHITHNEALAQLDLIVQLTVLSRVLTTAPALPSLGDRHIVAAGATGPWVGQSGRIALYAESGWQFTAPLPGWRAHVLDEGQTAVFDGLAWQTLADGPLTVGQLGVAATPDATNRLSVAADATLFTHAGAGHQLKLNKAAPAQTASLLFQTGFSGRAEMGTAGNDDFAVKVSADGTAFRTALQATAATGELTLPHPLHLGGQAADPISPPNGTLWLNVTSGEVKVQTAGAARSVGGGGSPGGAAGKVQWNNAGSFAGAADVEVENGQLRLPAIATPTPPAAGGLKLFGRSVGGRLQPAIIGPSGLESALQPFLARTKVAIWTAQGNTGTGSEWGMTTASSGTGTAANVATTNLHTYLQRREWLITAASTTAVVGLRGSVQTKTVGGPSAGLGGFHLVWRWAPATGVANASHRAFAGMRASTAAPTDVNPSTLTNLCGMGYDAADAHIQFLHNDGSGTATKIDLGAAFAKPAVDRTAVYEIAMFTPPGPAQVLSYEVTDLVSGAVAVGTVTTDLPATTLLLAPWSYVSVGGVSSVVGMMASSLYLESDY